MPTSLRAGVGALVASVFAAASLVLAGPTVAQTTPDITFIPVGPSINAGSLQVAGIMKASCDSNVTAAQVTITKDSVPVSGVSVTGGVSRLEFLVTVPASSTRWTCRSRATSPPRQSPNLLSSGGPR